MHRKYRIVELRELVGLNLFGDEMETWESIHISTLRNPKHWIKYITKEDTEPMYKGVDVGGFHQAWKVWNYVSRHPDFNPMDSFIRQNPSLTKIIHAAHADYWTRKAVKTYNESLKDMPVLPDVKVAWVRESLDALMEGKNVFIHGRTGIGKTVLARYVSKFFNEVIHLPCEKTAWEFGGLTTTCDLVIAGDVPCSWFDDHRTSLLRIADRTPLAVNVKAAGYKMIVPRCQLLVISNYEEYLDPALQRRFTTICAKDNGFLPAPTHIEIPEDMEETIEISDTEEENDTQRLTQRNDDEPTVYISDDDQLSQWAFEFRDVPVQFGNNPDINGGNSIVHEPVRRIPNLRRQDAFYSPNELQRNGVE